jgi:hypothetical protein
MRATDRVLTEGRMEVHQREAAADPSLWVPVDGRRGESRTAQLTRGALVTVVKHA